MAQIEPNVSKDGESIRIARCNIIPSGVKADFVKRELKLTIVVMLDDSALFHRKDLAFWASDQSPLTIKLKPIQSQLGLKGLSVDLNQRKITIDESALSDEGDDDDETA